MSAHPEQILYEAVHGREALRLGGRLEAPDLVLARRLMGDFSSIVRVLPGACTTDGITARGSRVTAGVAPFFAPSTLLPPRCVVRLCGASAARRR
jgi:hypothetical protein